MAAQIFDFEMEQGSTFKWDIWVKDPTDITQPYVLTNFLVRAMARAKYSDVSAAFQFTCTIEDDQNGQIRLYLTDEETAAIPKGSYYYDVEVESDTGEVAKIYKGRITVDPEATK